MASGQLLEIALRDLGQRKPERVRGDGETPEGVAELLDEAFATALPMLEDTFAYEAEYLTRFFRQPGGGVEEALVGREGRIRGAQGRALVFVECHGCGAIDS